MGLFCIDRDKCKRDGICAAVCPANIIKVDTDKYPYVDKDARCLLCGQCVAFCPHDACAIDKLPAESFRKVDISKFPSKEQVDALFGSRRSVRNFRKGGVDKAVLTHILDEAICAPTAKNGQPVSWIIINNKDRMVAIADAMAEACTSAEVVSQMSDSDRRIQGALQATYRKGTDVFLRNAPCMAISVLPAGYDWSADGIIAATYFELAAHANGLGTCWAGYFMTMARRSSAVRAVVGVPDGLMVSGALLLGNPLHKTPSIVPPRRKDVIWVD